MKLYLGRNFLLSAHCSPVYIRANGADEMVRLRGVESEEEDAAADPAGGEGRRGHERA